METDRGGRCPRHLRLLGRTRRQPPGGPAVHPAKHQWIDERIALPGFAGVLVTGLAMGFTARPLFRAPWLISGMLLLLLLLLAHLFVYRPTVSRMIRLLDTEGIDSPAFVAAAHREARLGIAMTVVMIFVVFLMVVKPALWG